MRGRPPGHFETRLAQPCGRNAQRFRVAAHCPSAAQVCLDRLPKTSNEGGTRASRTAQCALELMRGAHGADKQCDEARLCGGGVCGRGPLEFSLQPDYGFFNLVRFEGALAKVHGQRPFEEGTEGGLAHGEVRERGMRHGDDIAARVLLEYKGMHDARRNDEQGWRDEELRRVLGAHPAAAVEDDQKLVQVTMRMRPDLPIVEPAAVRNGFDVNEPLLGVARRLTIQKESRHGGRSGHAHHYRSLVDAREPTPEHRAMTSSPAPSLTLILIPGLLCDERVWASQRAALADLATIRIAEHGMRDSLQAMAEGILADAPPRFAVAGHSMGGRVALEVFRAAPERVAGMALMDTGQHPLPEGEAGRCEAEGRFTLLSKARTQGMRAMAHDWVQGMVYAERLTDAALIEGILDMFESKSPELYAAQIHALLNRPDGAPLLSQIECPTLVLCGHEDSWSPLQRHREIAAAIAGSRLVDIPHCGHMSTLECPDAVNEAMRTWLQAGIRAEGGNAGAGGARQCPLAAGASR